MYFVIRNFIQDILERYFSSMIEIWWTIFLTKVLIYMRINFLLLLADVNKINSQMPNNILITYFSKFYFSLDILEMMFLPLCLKKEPWTDKCTTLWIIWVQNNIQNIWVLDNIHNFHFDESMWYSQCCYHTVNFSWYYFQHCNGSDRTHIISQQTPKPHPHGWTMGCLL